MEMVDLAGIDAARESDSNIDAGRDIWWSGRPDFSLKWDVILDVTPWALIFYSITLIGAALNDLMPDFSPR